MKQLLVLAVTVALAACGGDDGGDAADTDDDLTDDTADTGDTGDDTADADDTTDDTTDDRSDGSLGESGVPRDTLLSDVTMEQAVALCEYAHETIGQPQTLTCNGETVEIEETDPECQDASPEEVPATCTVTVGEYEACIMAYEADPCLLLAENPPPACETLFGPACSN